MAPSLKRAFGFIIARSCIMMNVNWWLFSLETSFTLTSSSHSTSALILKQQKKNEINWTWARLHTRGKLLSLQQKKFYFSSSSSRTKLLEADGNQWENNNLNLDISLNIIACLGLIYFVPPPAWFAIQSIMLALNEWNNIV